MTNQHHQGHRQRVRNRFLNEGLNGFADHQLLEFLLFYAIPRKNTNELAHEMLREFGNLSILFESSPEEIHRRCQVNMNTAILISAIPDISKRYQQVRWGTKPLINSSSKAGTYAQSLFTGKKYESFIVINLDAQNNVIHASSVLEGTINEAPVYPRIIVETALRYQANSVILAHNHPGGSLRPSRADMDVTKKICSAMESIHIKVVDHIIVAGNQYYSFAENGDL